MTLPFSTRKSGPFTAFGGQTIFNYMFPITASSELAVWRLRAGSEVLLTLGNDYTVTGIGTPSGTVVLNAGALEGDVYVILGAKPLERGTAFPGWKSIPPGIVDQQLDALQAQIQEIRRDLARCLQPSPTQQTSLALPSPMAGRVLGWNDDADALENRSPVGPVWRGAWALATAFAANEAVSHDGSSFIALAGHTSGADTEPGVGVDWGLTWDLMAASGSGGGSGGIPAAADRAELANIQFVTTPVAYLAEGGRAGVFVWDGSDLSAEVAADTRQGIYVAPSGDTSGASGAWVRQYRGAVNALWFIGTVSLTDNSAGLQAAIDYCESVGQALYVPGGYTYPCTSGLTIQSNFFRMFSDAGLAIIRWDSTTGFLITCELNGDASTGALVAPYFENLRFQQGASYVPTAGGCFRLNRVAQVVFHNVRTDNFFIHYDTYGLTRATFSACHAFGSTLFPAGVVTPGTMFLNLDTFDVAGPSERIAANIKICNGTEMAGNNAAQANMQHCIRARAVDGLFVDTSVYIGLAKTSCIAFIPTVAGLGFTNVQMDCFVDGGQSTASFGYDFHENSVSFLTGPCNSIRIGGIISGCAAIGVRVNIAAMSDIRVHATIKACASFAINIIQGLRLNATGCNFFSNGVGNINNPAGATLVQVGTQSP